METKTPSSPEMSIRSKDNDPQSGKQVSLADFEALRITDKTEIPPVKVVLQISGEDIAVSSEIFALSGAAKAGKSGFMAMIIAASINDTGICEDAIDNMEVLPNTERKAVIHFDTEQARHKHKRNVIGILNRDSLTTAPEHFLSYNIRKLPLDSYKDTVSEICEAASNELGGIHSIYIDGGADFITGVNDEETSNEIVKYFESIAITYDTAVFVLVHTNPGGDKERGHFGSQLQRKAGGILIVKTEDDYSFIEAKILRYGSTGSIPKLGFRYNKQKGYHTGIGIIKNNKEQKAKDKKIIQALEYVDDIFSGGNSFQYNELLSELHDKNEKGIVTNKGIVTTMIGQGMIIKVDSLRYKKNPYYVYNQQD